MTDVPRLKPTPKETDVDTHKGLTTDEGGLQTLYTFHFRSGLLSDDTTRSPGSQGVGRQKRRGKSLRHIQRYLLQVPEINVSRPP